MNTGSASRVMNVFETFESVGKQMHVRELAERSGMPVSTCHGLVHALMKLGYLYSIGRRKEIYPNRRLLHMAQRIAANDPFLERIGAELERLRDACGETVLLGKRHDDEVVYLLALDSPSPLRYAAQAGDVRPLHATAMGKVFLAEMKDDELRKWLKTHPVKKITARTITSPDALVKDLAAGRKRGYFTASGENLANLAAIAVPLHCHTEPLSILIAGPDHRIEPRYAELALLLDKTRQRLEAAESVRNS